MRPIDADELKRAFQDYMAKKFDYNKCASAENCETCIPGCIWRKVIDRVPTLDVQQRWIPVTERLPEVNEKDPDWSTTVLFMTDQGYVHSGYRNIGRAQKSFYDDDWTPPYWLDESENLSFEEEEVTHWMPLPEPPKEDK